MKSLISNIVVYCLTGDYGKLGHGNSSTQKYPKLIYGLIGIVS